MQLKDLTDLELQKYIPKDLLEIEFDNITDDSRKIEKGDMFIAIKGTVYDGIDYLMDAIAKEAKICIVDQDNTIGLPNINSDKTYIIRVKNTREFFSRALFLQNKKYLPKKLITVTGTNGKSSVASFISQILGLLSIRNILVGTTGIYLEKEKISDCLTTPSPTDLISIFKLAKKNNIDTIVMESSSHGIDQSRISGLQFHSVGFTNISLEHLDYHKDLETYFFTKAKIFSKRYTNNVVINVDDRYGKKLYKICENKKLNIIDYGYDANKLKLLNIIKYKYTQKFTFNYEKYKYEAEINLLGTFQIYNLLCAICQVCLLGLNMADIVRVLPYIKEVDGRLNLVQSESIKGKIFIDFAHSPNALENVLLTLKSELNRKGNLLVLFGCGGNRDISKREKMGEIVTKIADVIYITDDNPRYEDPYSIRSQIIEGIKKISDITQKEVYNIEGREKAIRAAIRRLRKNDILLIAGKGHENMQYIRDKKILFNDRDVILSIINKKSNNVN